MKRLFVFDIDGTILTSTQNVLPSTKKAVKRIIANDDIAIINTGRTFELALPIAKLVGIHEILACNGGLYVNSKTKQKLFDVNFTSSKIKEIFDVVTKEEHFSMTALCVDKIIVYNHLNPKFMEEIRDSYHINNFAIYGENEKKEFIAHLKRTSGILKVSISPNRGLESKELLDKLPTLVDLSKIQFFSTATMFTEFGPKNITKWRGVEEYVKHFGIDPHEVYTFGDDINDLEMIREASHGIAMGNAAPEVKEVAHYITDSNDEDGIAKVVNMVYEGKEV